MIGHFRRTSNISRITPYSYSDYIILTMKPQSQINCHVQNTISEGILLPELLLTPTAMYPSLTRQETAKRLGHFVSTVIWNMFKVRKAFQPHLSGICLYSPTESVENDRILFCNFAVRTLAITKLGLSAVLFCLNAVQRFLVAHPRICDIEGSYYRLFIVGLISANKFLDDITYTNATWAKVTQKPVREINLMEREYLQCMSYQHRLSDEEYYKWLDMHDEFMRDHYLLPSLAKNAYSPRKSHSTTLSLNKVRPMASISRSIHQSEKRDQENMLKPS